MRTYTHRLTIALAVIAATLALLAATACGAGDVLGPVRPKHEILVTCRVFTIGGFEFPDADSVCTWLDTTTGQGGAGRGPTP